MKKFSIQFLLVVLLSLAFITPAFCQSASASDIEQEAVLTISEPGTGNSWSWNIPEEQIELQILLQQEAENPKRYTMVRLLLI